MIGSSQKLRLQAEESARAIGKMVGGPSGAALPASVTFSVAKSHKSQIWVRRSFRLDELITRMTTHVTGQKEGSAWAPATFMQNERLAANAETVELAVLDCDHGGETLDLIAVRLACAGCGGIISATHSHCPEKPRFRVILFPSAPWRVSDHQDRVEAVKVYRDGLIRVATRLGLEIDRAATDVARLFFDPRCPHHITPETAFVEGGVTDVWVANTQVKFDQDELELAGLLDNPQPKIPFEVLADAVMNIRNDERFGRTGWVKVVGAISYETGGSEEGRALAEQWSESWSGGEHDATAFDGLWRSLAGRK